jgi:hypothetical protein
VHLTRAEIQPRLEFGSLNRPIRWSKSLRRHLIGDVWQTMPIFAAQVSELTQFLPSGRYGAQSGSERSAECLLMAQSGHWRGRARVGSSTALLADGESFYLQCSDFEIGPSCAW